MHITYYKKCKRGVTSMIKPMEYCACQFLIIFAFALPLTHVLDQIQTTLEGLSKNQDALKVYTLKNELISLYLGNFDTIQKIFTKIK